jgi:aminopeptidase N
MKHIFSLFLIGITVFAAKAQDENSTTCANRSKFKGQSLKSNSLSVAQIAESERYNVHYYDLDLSMTNLNTSVSGTAEIHATANENLDSALFELFQTFTISEIRVNGTPVSYSRVNSAIKAPVNANVGDAFIIAVDYSGTPPTAVSNPLGGSGMTNATSPSWGNKVTWSLSESFAAYEWWPCKQSLTDKADSSAVKLTVPSNCKGGSNGILENVVPLGNGTTRYEWKNRHMIDYYLISVAVAKYVEYNIYANPVGATAPILIQNFIYDNPATLPNFQDEIDETVDFLELFSDLFGLYPFADEKYGHCMAPLSGGMEHQTMTTQGFFEKSLTAHELGHQWFGDNVTCASWTDIWVNEGFAAYSEYLMKEALYPGETTQHLIDIHDNIMSQPNGAVWVLDSLNESRIFDGRLTYDKGAAIVHTFRFMINDDATFFNALKNYQTNFKDSVAVGTDVKAELEAASGIDFTEAFDQWYFGEGYPTYSTRWNSVGSDLLLEITHTTSASSITPTFTNPLEIKFARSGQSDTTIRFDITSNLNQYFVPAIGTITNISAIDPSNWIINKVGTNNHDVNFLVGLDEQIGASNILLYPNPSNTLISIQSDQNCELTIFSTEGKTIANHLVNGNLTLDVSAYRNGNYLFVFKANGRIINIENVVKN